MPSEGATVVDALVTGRITEAMALVFEYMAVTQVEAGRPLPAGVDDLPTVLRDECLDLPTTYGPPGALLLACVDTASVGCVGLRPTVDAGVAEVKRLYVRPTYRRRGIAHALMDAALEHAERVGFGRLELDVMTTRTHVIAFYRGLGFQPQPPRDEWVFPMVSLGRDVPRARGR
jgi:ribosomal protein S18 acetylase RimI-like enzyme